MDIKGIESKLKDADSFLTTLKGILKKHWGLLLLLLFGYFIYWALTSEDVPQEPMDEEGDIEYYDGVWEYDLDENGDTLWYLDGELYQE